MGCHLHVCKWLNEHGAKEDIKKRNVPGFINNPLPVSINDKDETDGIISCQWLILIGGLRQDDSGTIDDNLMRQDFEAGRSK
jgi:hypothetical protein